MTLEKLSSLSSFLPSLPVTWVLPALPQQRQLAPLPQVPQSHRQLRAQHSLPLDRCLPAREQSSTTASTPSPVSRRQVPFSNQDTTRHRRFDLRSLDRPRYCSSRSWAALASSGRWLRPRLAWTERAGSCRVWRFLASSSWTVCGFVTLASFHSHGLQYILLAFSLTYYSDTYLPAKRVHRRMLLNNTLILVQSKSWQVLHKESFGKQTVSISTASYEAVGRSALSRSANCLSSSWILLSGSLRSATLPVRSAWPRPCCSSILASSAVCCKRRSIWS